MKNTSRNLLLAAAGCTIVTASALTRPGLAQPTPESEPAKPEATTLQPADATPVEPLEAEVILKDGRRVTGMLLERTPDQVRISIGGVPTTFAQAAIDQVKILRSVEERYQALRAAISDEDVEGLIRLAEWLRARGRFDSALLEIERALTLEPSNGEAKDLRVLIEQQKRIVEASGKAGSAQTHQPKSARQEFPLLSDEQINLMRVFEVDLKDPPRMIVPRDVVKQFLDKYAGQQTGNKGPVPVTPEGREVFMRQRPHEILAWFFELKAREFYSSVQVLENPRSMQVFKESVHRTWLVNRCATIECHGGPSAGRLRLYNKQANSDRSAYTNFLILERYRLDNGLPLIDYLEPAKSPLLELGLPREMAVIKHPEILQPGRARWKPAFVQGREDEAFRRAVNWILSMYPQRTDYPITYTPPAPEGSKPEPPPR